MLLPDPRRGRVYKNHPYQGCFLTDGLHFPVAVLPPKDGLPLKTPVVALRTDGGWEVFPAETLGTRAEFQDRLVVHAFWFAWYAMRPAEPAR